MEAARAEFIYRFNPIEHQWHRIKQKARKTMASTTQNFHDLVDAVIGMPTFPCLAIVLIYLQGTGYTALR